MTHFTNRLQIDELPEQLTRDSIDELLEDGNFSDFDMDDQSTDFESLLDTGYDF
jgi:hypothetical protein